MFRKQISSLVIAAAILLTLKGMPVQAGLDFTTNFTEGENGEMRFASENSVTSRFVGFLAVTDSSGLTNDTMQQDWIMSCTEWTDEDIRWANGMDAVMAEYDNNVRIYQILPKYQYAVGSDSILLCRQFFLLHQNIIDTMYLESPDIATAVWDGGFTFELQYNDADMDAVCADTELTALLGQYDSWRADYEHWYSETNAALMTASELAASRKAAGIASEYEITMQAYATAKEIAARHSDEIKDIIPTLHIIGATNATYRAESAWKSAGDINGDSSIDPADASAILLAIANEGANQDSGLTEAQTILADVNADGSMDSADASCILRYITESGATGVLEDFADFIRRTTNR